MSNNAYEIEIGEDLCCYANGNILAFVAAKNKWMDMSHDFETKQIATRLFNAFYHDGTDEDIKEFRAALKAFKHRIKKLKGNRQ